MNTVEYKGKTYRVLASSYLGNSNLWKLASRYSGGAPFAALKSKCRVLTVLGVRVQS
jgi:hypothetical protein